MKMIKEMIKPDNPIIFQDSFLDSLKAMIEMYKIHHYQIKVVSLDLKFYINDSFSYHYHYYYNYLHKDSMSKLYSVDGNNSD